MSAKSRNKGAAEWRDVSIDGGRYAARYQVSDAGEVRAHPNARAKGLVPGRILFQSRDERGYPQMQLWLDFKAHTVKVHRLVAHAFLGERPDGMTVNHIDGNKENNTVQNLEYVTGLENTRHAHRVIEGRSCVVVDGCRMSWPEAVEKFGAFGVTANAARRRFNRLGWSVQRALSTPIQPPGRPFNG